MATALAPGDAGLARLLQTVETAVAPGNTIKVEVRQVLVPVVVTDREGHHVAGLTQGDFHVFEDGVEQKITAFSVESTGLAGTTGTAGTVPAAARPAATPGVPAAASGPAKPHRTYMIVLDTLHTTFQHLASAREALVKLFHEEHSADSQYVVIALGASPEMVLNVTPDAAAVPAALESKKFQKIYLDGQMGGLMPEIELFRRGLSETRSVCDQIAGDSTARVKCAAGLGRVTEESRQMVEMDRALTTGFLRQFRSLVGQLARARDRRTIVFVSDGFEVEPGHEALSLVNAFFPPASHCLVPPDIFCPQNGLQSSSRMAEFEPILKLASAGNVTIHTIDTRGTFGQQGFDASNAGNPVTVDGAVGRVERNTASAAGNTLAEIAAATGGTAFHDNNNLLGGLERAFADGRDYYTLAYVSSNADSDGKFRAITVQVRDGRAVVNAKRGYWAAGSAQ